jgi:LysR family transcriptional regulator, transcriptional activator for dmlA
MLRSEWDIARHLRDGRLQLVLPTYFQTAHITAVFPERHNLSAKVRLFVNDLSATLKEAAKGIPLGHARSGAPKTRLPRL